MHSPVSAGEDIFSLMETIRELVPLITTSLVFDRFTSRFTFGESSTAIFNFGVVLDPLSESAQKWSSLLLWLLNIPGVSVDLRIHPSSYTEVSSNTPAPWFGGIYITRFRSNGSIGTTSDRPRYTTTMGKRIVQKYFAPS